MNRRKNSVAEDEEKEYNQKKEKNYDFAGVKAAAEMGAKAAGSSSGKSVSAGISAIASLAKSGVETAAKALTSATKKTNSTQQKPKEVTKTDAEKMVDFIYSEENLPKTEDFLFNNGFPSREDREYNKEFFGEQEEKKQTVDLFKAKTNSILNPSLPNKEDRMFLKGFMGDEEEERDYNKQVEDNKKAKSDYAYTFRGSPFEHFFTEQNPAPAGMPLKKQDPVAEIMAKAAQYQKNKTSEDAPLSNVLGTASTAFGIPGTVFDAANKQLENFNVVRSSNAPVKFNAAKPGSIDMSLPIKNDTFDMRFTYNDGKVSVTGKNHLLKKYADNAEITDFINKVDGAEAPKFVRYFIKNSDDVAKLKNVAKNGKKAFSIISYALEGLEVVSVLYDDYKDDGKLGKKSGKKFVSSLAEVGGSALGSAIGTKAGAFFGSLLCPGLGTVIGGFIGNIAGSLIGGALGEYGGEELVEAIV